MNNKLKKYIIISLGIVVPFLLGYLIWTWNPVEDFVGRFISFLDPHRSEHVMERLANKTDGELLRLLHHGDYNKAGAAKAILGQRSNPKLFDVFVGMLKDKSQEVRMMARTLLQVDKERAVKFYMNELKTLDKNSKEYEQTIYILSYLKYPPAFLYLLEYAKNDRGNRKNSAYLLKEFGDPRALPILEEMLKQNPGEWDVDEIHSAIDYLTQVNKKGTPSKSATFN